jgi:GNAT superfamily N-acetyltransferase
VAGLAQHGLAGASPAARLGTCQGADSAESTRTSRIRGRRSAPTACAAPRPGCLPTPTAAYSSPFLTRKGRSNHPTGGEGGAEGPRYRTSARVHSAWGDDRADEGDGLENRWSRKGPVGSNPTPPASDLAGGTSALPMTRPRSLGVVRLVEELASNAWPAYVVQVVGGWRLRFTPAVRARRSNSVLPLDDDGSVALEERLKVVEDFYGRRDVPVRYQISPAVAPDGLDVLLEERGFAVEAPVHVQTAQIDRAVSLTSRAAFDGLVQISSQPNEPWLATWTELYRRGDPNTVRRLVLDRIGPRTAFALLEAGGQAIAVGMGAVERGWLGLFSMGTLPRVRRRGAGRAVLNALARWGKGEGATRAYLQVEEDNEPALRLYVAGGFRTAYGYHYRTL